MPKAALPNLATVLPGVSLDQFRAPRSGVPLRTQLLSTWAAHAPKVPVQYLMERMRHDFGVAVTRSVAFAVCRKARSRQKDERLTGRPKGVQGKAPVSTKRAFPEVVRTAPVTLEEALATFRAAAQRQHLGITINIAVSA